MMTRIVNLFRQTKVTQIRISFNRCLLCGWPVQVKLFNDEMGVRCTKCKASAVTQSIGKVFRNTTQNQPGISVYELSSSGPFVRYLNKSQHKTTFSELFSDVEPGDYKNGVLCQDVQQLTFPEDSFDVCSSAEVFEHVEDDIKGFSEVYRVLKPGGKLLFTVPISLDNLTIERTRLTNGQREHILPAEYHSDKLKGPGKVFCYRNYGFDILKRLQSVGFINTQIVLPDKSKLFGFGRPVIYAEK